MNKTKKKVRVCISEALYPIMFYLIISSEDEILNTIYILDYHIDESVRKRLPNSKYENKKSIFYHNRWTRTIYGYWQRNIKYPFIRNSELYGLDFNWSLLKSCKFNYIEDCPNVLNLWETGALYREFLKNSKQHTLKKKILEIIFGEYYQHPVGTSKSVKTINVSGFYNKYYHQGKKIISYDLKKEWDNSSSSKKSLILRIFDITENDLKILKSKKIILLTQAFYEDKMVTEEEQIEIYRRILKNYSGKDVIIKPHPRDRLNYRIFFPEVLCFDKSVPLQFLSIIGVKFDNVVTVSSSSALSFGDKVKIDWYGGDVHPGIIRAEGNRTLEDALKNYRDQQQTGMHTSL